MIEQIRQPFQHLRSELLFLRNGWRGSEEGSLDADSEEANDPEGRVLNEMEARGSGASAFSQYDDSIGEEYGELLTMFRDASMATEVDDADNTNIANNAWQRSAWQHIYSKIPKSSLLSLKDMFGLREGLEQDLEALGAGGNVEDVFGYDSVGSITAIVAIDMEMMLREFVEADAAGRLEILHLVLKYYQNLDQSFPYVSTTTPLVSLNDLRNKSLFGLDGLERVCCQYGAWAGLRRCHGARGA